MINIDEFVQRLEERIEKYRQVQKGAWRVRGFLRVIKQQISTEGRNISRDIQKYMQTLKQEHIERINQLYQFSQKQLDKQRLIYEEQSLELKQQIAHQYKIINHLKKEMEDLMDMLNHQAATSMKTTQNPNQRQSQQNQQNNHSEDRNQTINGLEVIEEEETERTVMSSVNSFNEDGHFVSPDYFIKIQEKQKSQYENQNVNENYASSQNQNDDWRENNHITSNSEDQQWPSNCKFQGLLQSEVSSRQKTFQMERQSQDVIENWQSMPVSVQQGMGQRGEGPWSGGNVGKQLRQLTNQSEHQRQKKTKMFLEEFRKTFNKCLSTNVSRKNSKKDMSKPPKDKNRSLGATFGKIQIERPNQNKQSDNQKMINDMLRDIDNNNKFSVGGRRSQLKYQGEKRDGGRSGPGILYYSNGLCYQGEFKNNLRHGFGVLRFNQIQIYRGQWSADQLSGQGKIRNFAVINKRKSQNSTSPLSRWVSYCGYFKGNRFEGQGTLYLQGGEKFLGKFICGSACGEGTLYRKNGEVQTGVWRHNLLVQQF